MRKHLLLLMLVALVVMYRRPCNCLDDSSPVAVTRAKARDIVSHSTPVVELSPSRRDASEREGSRSHRNLFAFAELDPPPRQIAQLPEPTTTLPAPRAPAIPANAAPDFEYRYIGNFGPRNNPIAVFCRQGEVINARVGDVVGVFTLNRVGIESVEMRSDRAAVVVTRQVPVSP